MKYIAEKKDNKFFLGLIGVFIFGVIIGYPLGYLLHVHKQAVFTQQRMEGKYKFINPLLECELAESSLNNQTQNFHQKLSNFIEKNKKSGSFNDVSVVFRDLNNGPTFGINEYDKYIPASLLKVPVMMAYFDWSEENPSILEKEVLFRGKYEPVQGGFQLISSKMNLEVGKKYKISDLINRSIIYSDNQSVALLLDNIDEKRIDDVFNLLGLNDESIKKDDGMISVKEYSAFFRILFNASYLNRSNSEKALEILSHSDFRDGIVAGVPSNVVVAHKFGESGTLSGNHQLHDCGIVYYPNHPYLLCIMTSGEKTVELKGIIKDISQFVFEEISSQYGLR